MADDLLVDTATPDELAELFDDALRIWAEMVEESTSRIDAHPDLPAELEVWRHELTRADMANESIATCWRRMGEEHRAASGIAEEFEAHLANAVLVVGMKRALVAEWDQRLSALAFVGATPGPQGGN